MTTIKLKNGSGAPLAGDLVQGEPALDLTNKRLYTEDSGGTVIEVGTNPTSLTTGTFTSTGIDDNAASTAITIDSSQNVGIGTSNPSNTVTITNGSSGATEANGSIVPLMIENSSSAYINFLTPDNANAGFLFSDPEGNNVGQMQYLHGSDALVFATNASERMRIDSAGNVGIGVVPTQKLQVDGDIRIGDTAVGSGDNEQYSITTGGQLLIKANDGASDISFTALTLASGSSGGAATPSSVITFEVNDTERMRIDSSGNVKVNDGYLEVNAESAAAAVVRVDYNATDSIRRIHALETGGGNARPLQIHAQDVRFRDDTTERMRIDASGNVGIGTDSPFAPLHVGKSGASAELWLQRTDGYNPVKLVGSTLSDGQGFKINVNSSDAFAIDSNGNVGIGTDSTFGKLSINSNGAPETSGNMTTGLTVHNSTAGTAINIGTNDGGSYNYIQSAYVNNAGVSKNLAFFAGATRAVDIDASGNLLVGTTSNAQTDGIIHGEDTNSSVLGAYAKGTTSSAIGYYCKLDSANALFAYWNCNGVNTGSISTNGTSTSYNTSSDYRLKENVVPLTGATERLKQLPVHKFNFIANPDTTVDGFLAHEVADVVPEAITGTKDGMRDEEYEVTPAVYEDVVIPAVLDEEGNEVEAERTEQQLVTEAVMGTRSVPDYQGIDQSKLVPLLVATIQELEARITALESN